MVNRGRRIGGCRVRRVGIGVKRRRHSGAEEYATDDDRTEAATEPVETVLVMKAVVVRETGMVMEAAMKAAAMVKAAAVESAVNGAPVPDSGGRWCA